MTASGTHVHVIRHGRTALNAQGRFRGLEDVPLDETGLAEAEAVAAWLGGRPIVAIWHSPLLRARQTAEPLGRRLGISAEVAPDLLDLDIGAWTGLTPEEAAAADPEAFRAYREEPRTAVPPAGEPLVEAERRILRAIDEMAERFAGEEVAAVSHEVPIRLLVSHVMGIEGSGMWDIPLGTGSITTLHGSPGSWRVVDGPRRP